MLPISEIYQIDGEAIPSPSSCSVSMEDLEISSERTADGRIHRERARSGVRKVSLTYGVLTQEELQELLPRFRPVYFDLTYQDPQNGVTTIQCFCSAQSINLESAVLYNGLWRDITFDCMER